MNGKQKNVLGHVLPLVLIFSVVLAGFALLTLLQRNIDNVETEFDKQVENLTVKRELGKLLVTDINLVALDFYKIVVASALSVQQPLIDHAQQMIDEIDRVLNVLSDGGQVQQEFALNLPAQDMATTAWVYLPPPGQHYNLEVLILRPMFSTLQTALVNTQEITRQRNVLLSSNNPVALCAAGNSVRNYAKSIDAQLQRMLENANKLVFDANVERDELRVRVARARNNLQRNNLLAATLTLLGVLVLIWLIYRQMLADQRRISDYVQQLQQIELELHHTNAEIVTLNHSLEEKVEQRTSDLQISERQWREAFDAIRWPIFLHNHNGRITKANRAYLNRANCTLGEAYGRFYWEVFPKLDRPMNGCVIDAAQGNSSGCERESDLVVDNQVYRSQAFVVKGSNGEYLYSMHLLEDVTQARSAHDALRKSERRFQDITNSMDEILILVDTDLNLQFMNSAALRGYGVDPEGYVDSPCHESLWKCGDICKNCPSVEVLRSGKVARAMRYMPDGTIYARSIYPVHDHEGNITGCAVLATDVTEREKYIQELTRYEQILSTNIDLIAYYDDQHICLAANDVMAKYYGKETQDLVGKHAREIIGEERYQSYLKYEETIFHSKQPLSFDDWLVFAAAGLCFMHCSFTPYVDEQGKVVGIVSRLKNITVRAEQEAKLKLSAKVFESTSEGIIITDTAGTIIAVNAAFCSITGYSEDEVVGNNPNLLSSDHQDALFYHDLWQAIEQTGHWSGEIWNRRKNGDIYPEILTISSIFDASGIATNYVAVFSDITAMNEIVKQLDYQANHHTVTDLPNRRLLHARLTHSLQLAIREKHKGAVLYFDLDNFKHINDSLGHDVGDSVLIEAAARLQQNSREVDTVAHVGGDEFIIVLDHVRSVSDATEYAKNILELLQQSMYVGEHEFFITASVGISIFPDDGDSVEALIKNADAAMYQAKERGKNSYYLYSQDLTEVAWERVLLDSSLRRALQNEEFILYYQPQICLHTGEIVGCEALVRWQQPDYGLVAPDKFIPLCEENGIIVPLGEWVLRTACLQWIEWRDQGFALGRIGVNLSGRQIQQDDLLEMVERVLRETGCPVAALDLEITETFLMRQPEQAIKILQQISDLGVALSIDDFGTGQSSLNYLKRFPVNRLKIDRSFISDIQPGSEDCAIVKAIIAMGHGLDLSVIAEGVETELQQQFIADLNCDEAQGYLFSRPVPAPEFAALLKLHTLTPGDSR